MFDPPGSSLFALRAAIGCIGIAWFSFFGGGVLGRGATSYGGGLLLLDIDKGEGYGLLKLWCHWSLSGRMSAMGRFAKLAHFPKADISCASEKRTLRTSIGVDSGHALGPLRHIGNTRSPLQQKCCQVNRGVPHLAQPNETSGDSDGPSRIRPGVETAED